MERLADCGSGDGGGDPGAGLEPLAFEAAAHWLGGGNRGAERAVVAALGSPSANRTGVTTRPRRHRVGPRLVADRGGGSPGDGARGARSSLRAVLGRSR